MKKILLVAVALVIGGGIFAYNNGLFAQDAQKTNDAVKSTDSAWLVRCDEIKDGEKVTGEYCEMVQSLSVSQKDADPATAQRLLEIAIGYPPVGKSKANVVFILPLGILVSEDIVVDVDGKKAFDFKVKTCEAGGCIASFTLNDKEIGALEKGSVMQAKLTAASGQLLGVEMSLAGFGEALAKVKPKK